MPTWTERLAEIADEVADLADKCPGGHARHEDCPRCVGLIGLYEILKAKARLAERMGGVEIDVHNDEPLPF